MSATVREGGAEDLDAVMKVMTEAFDPAFGEAWTRAQCLGMLALPGTMLAIARADGAAAGFAMARLVLDEAELLLLAVRPACQRRGIASQLVAQIERTAANRGAAKLHLEMREGNVAAALYAALGFRPIGRRRDYYRLAGGKRADALTLARDLPPK